MSTSAGVENFEQLDGLKVGRKKIEITGVDGETSAPASVDNRLTEGEAMRVKLGLAACAAVALRLRVA